MLGGRADFEFRCFNNVNRFRNPENTLSPCSANAPTSNSGKHPYHIEHASSPVLAVFASPPLRRGRHFTFPQRGLPRLDHRICANVRSPSSVCASRAGLAVSHLSSVSEAGRATLFVYRVEHAVPSAFVSDAVSLCSVCCLTSSPASPRRLDRSAAPVIMSARPRLPPRRTRSLARFPARGRFPRTCVPAPRIGFGRCALHLPLFRIGCEYAPEPPRAPFSPNTYPAWGAEHPRTGARRAP